MTAVNVGDRFGRLTVSRLLSTSAKDRRWLTLCECGCTKEVSQTHLKRGSIQSCGCLRREAVKARATKHGKVGSKVYKSWQAIMQRCHNPLSDGYPEYGAVGIVVQESWHTFENFYAEVGDAPSVSHSIDRENNSLGYTSGNVRWATKKEQANNRNVSLRYELDGKLLSVRELADMAGVAYKTMYVRLTSGGYSVQQAVSAKLNQNLQAKQAAVSQLLYRGASK